MTRSRFDEERTRQPLATRVEHGPSPLTYPGRPPVQRLTLVSDDVMPAQPGEVYFAETSRTTRMTPSGRSLKVPRVEVTPGAIPGAVAFLDYHTYAAVGGTGVYVDYMRTRRDCLRRGLGRQLVNALWEARQDMVELDFGEMFHEAVGVLFRETRDAFAGAVRVYGKVRY